MGSPWKPHFRLDYRLFTKIIQRCLMAKCISTIGYEKADVADFVASLQALKIEQVIDIRELPQSRRPGFSKNVLAAHLENAGIAYLHFKALGDPKHGREAARRGDFAEFNQIYRAHADLAAAKAALDRVAQCAAETRSVLMCYERDHRHCHRNIVAELLSVHYSFSVSHVGVRHGLSETPNGPEFDRDARSLRG